MILKHVIHLVFIKSNIQKNWLYNTKYICSSDYDLFYKMFLDKNLNGVSTTKDELIGIVKAGGPPVNMVLERLIEETQIRIDNKQNLIIISSIVINTLFKQGLKKLFK